MEVGGVLLEREDAAEDGAGPDVVLGLAPSCWMSENVIEGGPYAYLNDWPHRRVVSRQSSVRPMGKVCHGIERRLADIVAIVDTSVQDQIEMLLSFLQTWKQIHSRKTRRDADSDVIIEFHSLGVLAPGLR